MPWVPPKLSVATPSYFPLTALNRLISLVCFTLTMEGNMIYLIIKRWIPVSVLPTSLILDLHINFLSSFCWLESKREATVYHSSLLAWFLWNSIDKFKIKESHFEILVTGKFNIHYGMANWWRRIDWRDCIPIVQFLKRTRVLSCLPGCTTIMNGSNTGYERALSPISEG